MNTNLNSCNSNKPIIKAKPAHIKVQHSIDDISVNLSRRKKPPKNCQLYSEKNLNVQTNSNLQSKSLNDLQVVDTPNKKPPIKEKPAFYKRHFNKYLQRSEVQKFDNNNARPFKKHNCDNSDSNAGLSDSNKIVLENFEKFLSSIDECDENTKSFQPVQIEDYQKAELVANEFLTSEQTYVNKLQLIHQVFNIELEQLNKERRFMPDEALEKIFLNTKSLLDFHSQFLLPQLDECKKHWINGPSLGDVMSKSAPFLKMYTDYVKHFQQSNDLINLWNQKSTIFSTVLADIEKRNECNNLSLQHYLIEPLQRVPRYNLLLEEYISKLPLECEERCSAEEALVLVKKSAEHINNQMNKIEEGKEMLKVSKSIVGIDDLISPHRSFIKRGPVTKVSARDASLVERYLFLFNDILLVCDYNLVRIGQNQQYTLKSKLDIAGMMISAGQTKTIENNFYLKSKQKCIEFHISSPELLIEWLQALYSAIHVLTKKKKVPTATLR